MQVNIGGCRLELRQGDITDEVVDLIVNAANSQLAGGGGVDGAIHRRGGPVIMAETERRNPQGCPTGSAVISSGGALPARFIAHAVGPRWRGGGAGERELLEGAYRRSLALAVEHDCQSVAFPAISAGIYGYPLDQAAHVALSTTIGFLQEHGRPELVRFVLFNQSILETFAQTLSALAEQMTLTDGNS